MQYRCRESSANWACARRRLSRRRPVEAGGRGFRYPLTPTYRDGFSSSAGSVRFIRDSGGRVIEISIRAQRMWDLRLPRIEPPHRSEH